MTLDLAADLKERWRPTDKQIAAGDALLAVTEGGPTVTVHLLVDKTFGIWTTDVAVIALDGVFTDRLSAWKFLNAAAATYAAETGRAVTGGYTYHYGDGEWAVFEDVGTRFPNTKGKES